MKIVIDLKKLTKPLLIVAVILLLISASFGAVKANDYWQVKKLVKSADDLAQQEKYQEALGQLALTQSHWTTSKIRQEISNKQDLDQQLLADLNNFNLGNDLFGQSKWQEAKDTYAKVSDKSSHYKEAQDKMNECQGKIDEAKAQAAQQKKQSSVVSDPFPSLPDYSKCDGISDLAESLVCTWGVGAQYEHDKEAWYARHGQTMPQEPTSNQTTCRWVGDFLKCNTD